MTQYNYHTASRKILGDLITPVSAYLKVRDAYPQSALMESSDYHGGENAKSFIAVHPIGSVSIEHGMGICKYPDNKITETPINEQFTSADLINQFIGSFDISGPESNYCGLYGYTSFNAVRYFENIGVKDEIQPTNDAPDLLYILYKDVIVFDHFRNELTIIEMLTDGEEDDLDVLERDLNGRPYQTYEFHPVGEYSSTLTDDEHRENIRKGIAHCLRGDVFQIVLSRRFRQRYEGDDFKLYRALRSINPSPYLFYFDFGGFRIFGCLLINMDSQAPNKAAAEALPRLFPTITSLRPEATFGNSRLDFCADMGDKKLYVEVKGCTLEEDSVALFPDAPTERGVKHLHELEKCVQAGHAAALLIVIQMKSVRVFRPNRRTHPAFADALRHARDAGVQVLAYDCIVTPDSLTLDQSVAVEL